VATSPLPANGSRRGAAPAGLDASAVDRELSAQSLFMAVPARSSAGRAAERADEPGSGSRTDLGRHRRRRDCSPHLRGGPRGRESRVLPTDHQQPRRDRTTRHPGRSSSSRRPEIPAGCLVVRSCCELSVQVLVVDLCRSIVVGKLPIVEALDVPDQILSFLCTCGETSCDLPTRSSGVAEKDSVMRCKNGLRCVPADRRMLSIVRVVANSRDMWSSLDRNGRCILAGCRSCRPRSPGRW
jgi:hypothetical protein